MPILTQKQLNRLTPACLDMLYLLARYRHLTPSQMVDLGITKNRNSLYPLFARFRDLPRPVIETTNFSRIRSDRRGSQKLESMHHLTPRGFALLAEIDPDFATETAHPKINPVAERDYDHRSATIDLHIIADQFAETFGCRVDCFDVYFVHTGANNSHSGSLRRGNTTLTFDHTDGFGNVIERNHRFAADAISHITDPTGKPHLFAIEVQRGSDAKRLYDKLRTHYIPALGEGAFNTAYGTPALPKILIVCEDDGIITKTLQRLKADPLFQGFEACFAFQSLDQLKGNSELPFRQSIRGALKSTLKSSISSWQQSLPDQASNATRFAMGWRFLSGDRICIFDA